VLNKLQLFQIRRWKKTATPSFKSEPFRNYTKKSNILIRYPKKGVSCLIYINQNFKHFRFFSKTSSRNEGLRKKI
jgi:hypothetical protein